MRRGIAVVASQRITLALTLCAIFGACGDPTSSTPSPEVVATAEAVARTVNFTAQDSTTPEKDDEEKDPIVLDARVFGNGPTGVILAHMRPADQSSWFPFATELATTGDYIAMSRSQRFTQSARLSATNCQSTPNMVALVGMPAGTGVSLLVGSEKVTEESLACTSGPIISLM